MPGAAILDLAEDILSFLWMALMLYALRDGIIGKRATVLEAPNPYALIKVQGGKWRAVAEDGGSLAPGDSVVVSGVRGLQLAVVSRETADAEETVLPRDFSKAGRLFMGTLALLYLVKALKAGSEGIPFWTATDLTLAIFAGLVASGALPGPRLTWPKLLLVLLLIAIVVFGGVWLWGPRPV